MDKIEPNPDWQPGDIAVSLRTFVNTAKRYGHATPVKGRFYTVTKVTQGATRKGLLFKDVPSTNPFGYSADRFLKVTPPEDMIIETEEREVETYI